jgi:flagellar biosynthesis chaperone FliJ
MEMKISYSLQEVLHSLVSNWFTTVKDIKQMEGAEEIWTHERQHNKGLEKIHKKRP